MPQRFLRPGITTSKRFNRCDLFAQCVYIRLLTLVDDYGRYEADAELIRSQAWPYGLPDGSQIDLPVIASGLTTLARNQLLILYTVDDKEYLQLTRWKERIRSESRFPAPHGGHLPTVDNKCVLTKPSPAPAPTPAPTPGVSVLTELETRLGTMFKRATGTPWSYAEQSELSEISRRPDALKELAEIETFSKRPQNYFPKSLQSLLSKWGETLDRARLYVAPAGKVERMHGAPSPADVHAYANDKWPDDPRRTNWAASFHAHWNARARNWQRHGKTIDWQIELSQQVSKWKAAQ